MLEAVILLGVGFIPTSFNLLANSFFDFVCLWHTGGKFPARFMEMVLRLPMCIGNMRFTGTQNLFNYFHSKDRDSLRKAGLYYGIYRQLIILGAVFREWIDRIIP